MFGLPDIHIKYRVDRRIRVAEVIYKGKKILTSLDTFVQETGITDFEESTSGEAFIGVFDYNRLLENTL